MADKAYIYVDSEGEARVYPPVLVIKKPDPAQNKWNDFEIQNLTGETFALAIEENVLEEGSNKIEVLEIKKKVKKTLTPKTDGAFAYSVIAAKSGKKAKGNSDPVIIIEM